MALRRSRVADACVHLEALGEHANRLVAEHAGAAQDQNAGSAAVHGAGVWLTLALRAASDP